MGQFKANSFKFDGIDSRMYSLSVVNINNDGFTSSFGKRNTINEEEGVGEVPVFYGVKGECQELTLELFKCDSEGNPLVITDSDKREISRWLFKREPKALECNGLIYYCICTDGNLWTNEASMGCFEIKLRMSSPYAYSPIMYNPIYVTNSKTIEVYNKSTVDESIYPDIEFLLMGNSTSIKITNMTTGQVVEFSGLEKQDNIYVYNDGVKQIVSKIDAKRNIFKLFNKEWLELVYGKNIIKIECENCKFNLLWQNKVYLY